MLRFPLICIVLFTDFVVICKGQNLVPNGDFEKSNICYEYLSRCSPGAWFNSRVYGGFGYNHPSRVAASGYEYLDLTAAGRNKDKRDYWETMLLCPLEPGKLYHISLNISADKVGPNLNDIGFYFTDGFIFSQKDSLFQPDTGVLGFTDATVHRMPNGWFSVRKDFRPSAAARFLIIGNFSRKSNTDIINDRKLQNSVVRIFVDDVSIIREGGDPCPGMDKIRDSLYAIRSRHPKDAPDTVKTKPFSDGAIPKPDTIRLGNVLFEFGKYALKDTTVLEQYRSVLADTTVKRLEIAGYADDAGSREYNIQLSLDRAQGVAGVITEKFGIPASRIRITGKGISTEYADKSLNRRVEIYVYHR